MFHRIGGTKESAPCGNSEEDPIKTMHRHLKWALGSASTVLLVSITTTIVFVGLLH